MAMLKKILFKILAMVFCLGLAFAALKGGVWFRKAIVFDQSLGYVEIFVYDICSLILYLAVFVFVGLFLWQFLTLKTIMTAAIQAMFEKRRLKKRADNRTGTAPHTAKSGCYVDEKGRLHNNLKE